MEPLPKRNPKTLPGKGCYLVNRWINWPMGFDIVGLRATCNDAKRGQSTIGAAKAYLLPLAYKRSSVSLRPLVSGQMISR
ncbi:MAG: hypothetical protein WA299_14355, partial [Candidatus Acidiferrum sp.]